jgi:hypothetical protein
MMWCHLDRRRADVWNNDSDSEQKTARDPFSFPLYFFSLPSPTQEKVGKQIMASFSYDGRFR